MPRQHDENLGCTEFMRARIKKTGLGSSELARRMTAAGYPMRQSAAWSIMNDQRRRVTLDEAVGLCSVFGWSLDDFAEDLKQRRRAAWGEYAVLLP